MVGSFNKVVVFFNFLMFMKIICDVILFVGFLVLIFVFEGVNIMDVGRFVLE